MRASRAASTETDQVGSMREGVLMQKHLLIGEDGSLNNYDLNVGLTGSGGWRTPRHRHNFDQIRYVIKGDYPYMPNKVLPEGWIAYFPESVRYGPQDRPEGLQTMVLQFGGASGNGYLSVAGREIANDALKAKGEFEGGAFVWRDEEGKTHKMDASAACFEHATGRKLEFATPRYESVVAMDPNAYAWMPGQSEGVEEKWLGSFTERDMRIGFVRIEAGTTWRAGPFPSIAVLFQTRGEVIVAGEQYPSRSAFEIRPEDGEVAFEVREDAEFLCMVLHRF